RWTVVGDALSSWIFSAPCAVAAAQPALITMHMATAFDFIRPSACDVSFLSRPSAYRIRHRSVRIGFSAFRMNQSVVTSAGRETSVDVVNGLRRKRGGLAWSTDRMRCRISLRDHPMGHDRLRQAGKKVPCLGNPSAATP